MSKTRNEGQPFVYLLLLSIIAIEVCCVEVLFQLCFLVLHGAFTDVSHAERSLKCTT